MRVCFLGTGAGLPSVGRNVSSVALALDDGQVWLFDAGEGTQHQLMRTSVRPGRITKIFITHTHGDHMFGLPGLLSSRAFHGGPPDVDIYGPAGVRQFVEVALGVSATHLPFRVTCHEVCGGELFDADGWRVTAAPLDHVVPAYGFRVQEGERAGELRTAALQALGVEPGPVYGRLKNGENVRLGDGTVLCGRDFVGPPRRGRAVAYTGDTRPTPATVALAQGADVLIHESTYAPGNADLAERYGHSTSAQAAEIARDAGVGRLLLTHISARYSPEDVIALRDQARAVFPNTDVMADFDEVEVPLR